MVKKLSDRRERTYFEDMHDELRAVFYDIFTRPFCEGVAICYTQNGTYLLKRSEMRKLGITGIEGEARRTANERIGEILQEYK